MRERCPWDAYARSLGEERYGFLAIFEVRVSHQALLKRSMFGSTFGSEATRCPGLHARQGFPCRQGSIGTCELDLTHRGRDFHWELTPDYFLTRRR